MKIICDSGAYSAWKQGISINIADYAKFLHANADWIDTAVSLDYIDPNDPENAAKVSWENWLYLNKQGLKTVPVWHAKENVDWLHRYLDAGCDYVGLSATSLRRSSDATLWYAQAWENLSNSAGIPVVKTHVFGEATEGNLSPFPWYSADSASWLLKSNTTAAVTVNKGRMVSLRTDGTHTRRLPDIDRLSENDSVFFDDWLRTAGVDREQLKRQDNLGYALRMYLIFLNIKERIDRVNLLCPIKVRKNSLWPSHGSTNEKNIHIPKLNFNFVLSNNPTAAAVLAFSGWNNCLVSYYGLKNGEKQKGIQSQSFYKIYAKNPVEACQHDEVIAKYYNGLVENVRSV